MSYFQTRFEGVTFTQMLIVGPERYYSVGMRLGKLVLREMRVQNIEMHIIEYCLYLFLKLAALTVQLIGEPVQQMIEH
jgi:hypothetical protein